MFKTIRIIFLLTILLFVGLSAYTLDASLRDWDRTKWVVVYPINGDGSDVARDYIKGMTDDSFSEMTQFLNNEAVRFGVKQSPAFIAKLGPVLDDRPPKAPQNGRWYEHAWWSLRLRLWARGREQREAAGPPADIKIYVEYYNPMQHPVLPHSVGMKKLSIAVVNAYASRKMTQANNVVIAHELLHIFGAMDKYDMSTSLPLYPDGYAEPDRRPLYPQRMAEIMGGRIPLSQDEAKIPASFRHVLIREKTAEEIGWLR